MKNAFKHWKTTSAGIIAIVTGIALYVSDHSKLTEALTAVLGGVGLIFAADSSN